MIWRKQNHIRINNKSYGHRLGKLNKSRVNTISQSPTLTTAGAGIEGFNSFKYAEKCHHWKCYS